METQTYFMVSTQQDGDLTSPVWVVRFQTAPQHFIRARHTLAVLRKIPNVKIREYIVNTHELKAQEEE